MEPVGQSSRQRRVLFIFGTRPEAIKLSPVVLYMRGRPDAFDVRVCVTAQHRQMLDQVLEAFGIRPDHDLNLMRPNQSLPESTARMVAALEPVIAGEQPDIVLVQGDTTTTFCGALAAFYARVPVGHVEAGLRTGDMEQPFPEEMNRVLTSRLARWHFAPTERAAANLRAEGVDESGIVVTGNSGIDAVLHVKGRLEAGELAGFGGFDSGPGRRLIVMTAHRRESFGAGFERILEAVAWLARREDVEIVYPVHPNPNVRGPVEARLKGLKRVHLIEPLDYVPFVDLMRRSYFLITDSGGVQEEAPSLGKPVLVLREKTERPEAVAAGTVKLVGTDAGRITREASALLDDEQGYQRMARTHNPYGDGRASGRIAAAVLAGSESGVIP
ncbi:MAG: UDP-N-acetylglucosamine 2-epimerase (non-hydrolyzing) [Bryobacterales bacterium]|nr:UDP-N-acetylglucosamine 2-epimerase (non-hydrolyzing) [Bryobacterales bacterium]